MSMETLDSLSSQDHAAWRKIRKELEEIGITPHAFEANHKYIFDWFNQAANTGAFEKRPLSSDDEQAETGIESPVPLRKPSHVSMSRRTPTSDAPSRILDPTEKLEPLEEHSFSNGQEQAIHANGSSALVRGAPVPYQ